MFDRPGLRTTRTHERLAGCLGLGGAGLDRPEGDEEMILRGGRVTEPQAQLAGLQVRPEAGRVEM